MSFFNLFKKQKETELFAHFLRKFPPGKQISNISAEQLANYNHRLPQELQDFLLQHGERELADGLLTIINPKDYQGTLNAWLGQDTLDRIPLFKTAFGDLIYYRHLDDTTSDIALLDIHYRQTPVLAYQWQDFFSQLALEDQFTTDLLKQPLYQEAVKSLGPLAPNECYFFTPALVFGGSEQADYLDKGDLLVHHHILQNAV
ncbi:T6SS immunity protein Tdi1 domain-containing protein [Streptococcus entericus]|uniref:T6SS immunity protein Tdi1 domain-containing protein n=1 Tax=Streptococcus entericus TaxID=155680 RepID=UPI00036337E6|nr:T6SS immunity protein Tdi1 domain-containing protein [Streptococcus entericus]